MARGRTQGTPREGDPLTRRSGRPDKAYRNVEFLNSSDARILRIIAEYLEPASRFRHHDVEDTIVFFGSARSLPAETAREQVESARKAIDEARHPAPGLTSALQAAECGLAMSRYYEDAMALSRRMTEWSKGLADHSRRFIICSGAGPGIMEAANRGASSASGLSVGLGISLPHEPTMNPWVSRELAFEFHYFFMRKFWFAYLAKALVVFPGGFGTMDELFEVLTLVQTEKARKQMPIVLYGTSYWDEVLDFPAMVRWGTIGPLDPDLVHRCDDVDCAFDYLTSELTRLHLTGPNRSRREAPPAAAGESEFSE